jgi:hypothetical protein
MGSCRHTAMKARLAASPRSLHLLIDAPQFTVCEERTGFRFETEHV